MPSEHIEAKRIASHKRITHAALKCFASHGFEATTMTDIARELGMTGPSLYHYFPTKDALLFVCIEHTLDDLLHVAEKAIQTDQPVTLRIQSLIRAHTLLEIKQRSIAPLINAHLYGPSYLKQALTAPQRQSLRQKQLQLVQIYSQLIDEGCEQGLIATADSTIAAFNSLAIVQYTSVWYRPRKGLGTESIVQIQCEAVGRLLGIKPA
jgi:AcrR family transcriptional regulator